MHAVHEIDVRPPGRSEQCLGAPRASLGGVTRQIVSPHVRFGFHNPHAQHHPVVGHPNQNLTDKLPRHRFGVLRKEGVRKNVGRLGPV